MRFHLLCAFFAALPHALAWYRISMDAEIEKTNAFENSTTASKWSKDNAWRLGLMKGVMKGQILHLRKLDDHPNKWHTLTTHRCTFGYNKCIANQFPF